MKCNELVYSCNHFGKVAKNEKALNCHINNIPNFPCDVAQDCNLKFQDVDAYGAHILTHISPRPTRKRKLVEQTEDTEEDIDLDDSTNALCRSQ